MDEITASCEHCGKSYTGATAANQLRGHRMKCAARTKQEKTEMPKQPEPAVKQEAGAEAANLNPNLTAEERAIVERVMGQDAGDLSWMTVTEGDMEDYSLQTDPMELPEPAKRAQREKRFAFHWAKLDPQRIDQLTKMATPPHRFALATRTTFPELAPFVNDAYGCVTRHDCALLFKPWHHHEVVKRMKAELNQATEQGKGIKGKQAEMSERDGDVEAMSGKKYRISSADEVQTIKVKNDDGTVSIFDSPDDLAGSDGEGELAATG